MAERPVTVTTVDVLRHGHCEGGRILRGSTDSPLSERGWQQMRDSLINESGWDKVFTSPLQRCHSFATAFAARHSLPLETLDALQEVAFGEWDGELVETLLLREGEVAQRFFDRGEPSPPGAESFETARERAMAAWKSIINECKGQHLLLVTHGGIIRLLMAALSTMPFQQTQFIALPHAAFSRLQVYSMAGKPDRVALVLHHGETPSC